MNTVVWIATALLAAAFAAAGLNKVLRSKEALVTSMGAWAADFPPAALKALGAVEVLGALGLLLPAWAGTARVLVPVAATGLALVAVGAIVTHVRIGETGKAVPAVVLLLLAVLVAWGRFGPYAW